MSTNLAVGIAIGSSMSSSNSSAARAAKKIACKPLVDAYEAKTATVQEAKQYASCIDLLHPDSIDTSAIKVSLILMLVFIVTGAVYKQFFSRSYRYGGDWVEGAVLGFIVFIVAFILTGIFYFIAFA